MIGATLLRGCAPSRTVVLSVWPDGLVDSLSALTRTQKMTITAGIIHSLHKLMWSVVFGLWSSGQSSWLQIRRPGFNSRHYLIFWERKK
jgi:hypothetical protein